MYCSAIRVKNRLHVNNNPERKTSVKSQHLMALTRSRQKNLGLNKYLPCDYILLAQADIVVPFSVIIYVVYEGLEFFEGVW